MYSFFDSIPNVMEINIQEEYVNLLPGIKRRKLEIAVEMKGQMLIKIMWYDCYACISALQLGQVIWTTGLNWLLILWITWVKLSKNLDDPVYRNGVYLLGKSASNVLWIQTNWCFSYKVILTEILCKAKRNL